MGIIIVAYTIKSDFLYNNIHFIKKERPHCIIVFFRKNIFVIFKNNNYFSKSKINNDKIISYLSKQYNDYFIYNVNFNDF